MNAETVTPADPDNWIWANGPVEPGRCVVVDVDGVIADGSDRQHLLQQDPPRWTEFFDDAGQDPPVGGSVEMVNAFDSGLVVVILTARPARIAELTRTWLIEHSFRWDLLITRSRSHRGVASPEFKRESIQRLRGVGFEPQLAIDDDRRNIAMLREENVPALYLHSGYYEA